MTGTARTTASGTRRTAADSVRPTRDTRTEIVRIALEEFAEHGYEGASLQQIADRLGVTKAALYYHFRSKDDLLLAVLEPYLADVRQMLASRDESAAPPQGDEGRVALEEYLDFLLRHRVLISYLARDAAAYARPVVAELISQFWTTVLAVVSGADLDPADEVRVSFALGGMQQAISLHADVPSEELREPILRSVELVLGSIEKPRSRLSSSSG